MSWGSHLDELDGEIRDHLDREAEALVAAGMTPDEARAAARRKFGSILRIKEDARAVWIPVWIDQLTQDMRYGLRLVRRRPGFYAVAVLTIALGIGATTMLFSVANGVLLRPLPWLDADRLVRITETRQGRTGRVVGTVSNGTFLAWGDHASTLEGLGGWLTQMATLTGVGDPTRLSVIATTPNLFAMLRVRPLLGRLFVEGEGAAGQPGLAILSYGLWQERFGGRPEIVGTPAVLDAKAYTIIGVMPRDFAFPDRAARVWTAWRVPQVIGENGIQTGVIFRAIGRLRAGSTAAQAAAEATARARSAPDMGFAATALFGSAGPIDVSVIPELQAMTGQVRPAILVLFAAASLLLFTAIANVASLQMARATARRREVAVRAAIGAGQRRIVRHLLVENGIIGLSGGAAGLALAAGFQRWLLSVLPDGFPRLDAVAVDLRVCGFALTASVVTSVACGLLPAWQTRRVNLVELLSEDGAAPAGGTMRSPMGRARGLIMVGQVATACVLLLGAALFMRSFVSLMRADRGYDPANVLTARLPLPRDYPAEGRNQLLERLIARLRAAPGVTHAAYSSALPFVSFGGFTAFTMRSPHNPEVEVSVQAAQRIVSPDYFGAMRLRLIAGRTLTDADTTLTRPVVVVNRTFARQYLGEPAIGVAIPQRGRRAGGIRFGDAQPDPEVVGVVEDMRQEVDGALQPEIFASAHQISTATTNIGFDPILVVRTTADPTSYVSTLRHVVREEAPAFALDAVATMDDRVMTSLATPRLYAVVLVWFGAVALVIAGVGLFGVLAFSVALRTREIGVRSALGAQRRDIVVLVLGQALWIVGLGLALGMTAALVGGRLLSASLYGISPHDAITFVTVPIVIVVVAVIACLVPAYRAANANPLTAMRA